MESLSLVSPTGSIGYRWGEKGKWNTEQRDGISGAEVELELTPKACADEIVDVAFPYFGGSKA